MRRSGLAVLATFLGLLACQAQPAAAPAGLSMEDETAIEEVTRTALAIVNAGMADFNEYAAAYYTADAIVMPPNAEAVTGRDAIAAMLGAFPPLSNVMFEAQEIHGLGDLAVVRGTYSLTMSPPDAEPIQDRGKYIELWRKRNGIWRVARDIFNSDLPAM